MTNQDKKEVLEMIAKAAENSKTKETLDYRNGDWHLIEAQKFINNLRSEASSLHQDKPERKMPEVPTKKELLEADDNFPLFTESQNAALHRMILDNRWRHDMQEWVNEHSFNRVLKS